MSILFYHYAGTYTFLLWFDKVDKRVDMWMSREHSRNAQGFRGMEVWDCTCLFAALLWMLETDTLAEVCF